MLGRFLEFGTEIYLLWGIGLLGFMMKIFFDTYLNKMIKATENMATTKKKKLRLIRQRYENYKSFGKGNTNSEMYVERNVRKLRFLSIPIEFWKRSGVVLLSVLSMTMIGTIWFYSADWVGSSRMKDFICSGLFVGAFLVGLENIFLVSNKMEIVKANIRDYLDNITPQKDVRNNGSVNFTRIDLDKERKVENENRMVEDGINSSDLGKESAATFDDSEESKEVALNSFLKEFFS